MSIKKYRAYRMFLLLGCFSIAMGFLEASVAIYLRELYYPGGFDFPLKSMPPGILKVELTREICTLVMLLTIALAAGKNKLQKFAWFIYCFGIWDIFYYVGLKVVLNWPPSLLTWDLLFLLPVAWTGPVLAPVICSLTMILLAACIVQLQEKAYDLHIKFHWWGLIISGAFIIFIAFILDFTRLITREGLLPKYFNLLQDPHFQQVMAQYKPVYFTWPLFLLGEILILSAVALMVTGTVKTNEMNNHKE